MHHVLCSFSQIPDFGGLWWLSYLATIMSICYVRPSGHACSSQTQTSVHSLAGADLPLTTVPSQPRRPCVLLHSHR